MQEETFYHSLASVPLSQIVKKEYRDYQIYTLMDRAIPYLQDGLKPCQRRILYTLWKNMNKGLMKVSSATGLVLTLHPHGPASIESSLVNLAQDFTFSNNYPLLDKKGYFGERMETAPAAGRYIECKLSKMAEELLFDDMNQVQMIPNYDERVMEPVALYPKLPIMLLNGSEGIGTGFSSVIPSFHHRDIIASMISFISSGRVKKLKPWVNNYKENLDFDANGKIVTKLKIEEIDDKYFITELPKGYDSQRIYKLLAKHIEADYIKDYIDSSVDNDIKIELIFKKGQTPPLDEAINKIGVSGSLTPNYTLISERGVKVLKNAEEIIKIFTSERIVVVRRRYELLAQDAEERLARNNEIIRFIKEKHYAEAQKCSNRKHFLEYLTKKKFKFADYLADMPIYRLTKEEVAKRQDLITEDTKKLKEYRKIAKSEALVKEKLVEELTHIRGKLSDFLAVKEKEKKKLYQALQKNETKRRKKRS